MPALMTLLAARSGLWSAFAPATRTSGARGNIARRDFKIARFDLDTAGLMFRNQFVFRPSSDDSIVCVGGTSSRVFENDAL